MPRGGAGRHAAMLGGGGATEGGSDRQSVGRRHYNNRNRSGGGGGVLAALAASPSGASGPLVAFQVQPAIWDPVRAQRARRPSQAPSQTSSLGGLVALLDREHSVVSMLSARSNRSGLGSTGGIAMGGMVVGGGGGGGGAMLAAGGRTPSGILLVLRDSSVSDRAYSGTAAGGGGSIVWGAAGGGGGGGSEALSPLGRMVSGHPRASGGSDLSSLASPHMAAGRTASGGGREGGGTVDWAGSSGGPHSPYNVDPHQMRRNRLRDMGFQDDDDELPGGGGGGDEGGREGSGENSGASTPGGGGDGGGRYGGGGLLPSPLGPRGGGGGVVRVASTTVSAYSVSPSARSGSIGGIDPRWVFEPGLNSKRSEIQIFLSFISLLPSIHLPF